MTELPEIDRASIESWLSAPRYKRYLEVADGDDSAALDLYLWNIGLAQAVLRESLSLRSLSETHTAAQ